MKAHLLTIWAILITLGGDLAPAQARVVLNQCIIVGTTEVTVAADDVADTTNLAEVACLSFAAEGVSLNNVCVEGLAFKGTEYVEVYPGPVADLEDVYSVSCGWTAPAKNLAN